jgi:hypothetical protein
VVFNSLSVMIYTTITWESVLIAYSTAIGLFIISGAIGYASLKREKLIEMLKII